MDVLLWQVGIRRGGLGLRSIARHGPVVDAFQHLPAFASFPFSDSGSSSPSSPNGDYLGHFSQPLLRFAAFREAPLSSCGSFYCWAHCLYYSANPDDRLQRFLSQTARPSTTLNNVGKRRLKTLGCKSTGLAVYPQPAYRRAMHECKQNNQNARH